MSHVATVTIDSTQVSADLTDYVVNVDLSDLPTTGFWDVVANGGGDIRVYKDDDTTELPREVVSCDTSTDTGELHIKYTGTLSSTVDTDIHIYADGTSSEPAVTATYGRNAVWTDYELVAHLNNLTDSTGNNTLTANGGVTVGGITGVLGDATEFDGVDDSIDTGMSLASYSEYTYQAWAQLLSAGEADFLGVHTTGGSKDGTWMFGGSTGYTARIREGSTNVSSLVGSFDSGLDLIHATFKTSDGGAVYTNGSLEASDSNSTAGTDTTNFYIGATARGNKDCRLEEVRVRLTQLSSNWITTEYNNQNSPSTFYSATAVSTGDVTYSASALTATFSIPTTTTSTGTTTSIATVSATFSIPAVTTTTNSNQSPTALTATFSIPTYTVLAPDTVFLAATVNATFSIPSLTVTTDNTVAANALSAVFGIPAYTAIIDNTQTPNTVSATFTVPAYLVDVEFNIVGQKITPQLFIKSERVRLKKK